MVLSNSLSGAGVAWRTRPPRTFLAGPGAVVSLNHDPAKGNQFHQTCMCIYSTITVPFQVLNHIKGKKTMKNEVKDPETNE